MPKGKIFIIGLLSIILAIGMVVVTRLAGKTINELGATPKLHLSMAPPHTTCPIKTLLYLAKIGLESDMSIILQNFSRQQQIIRKKSNLA